MVLHPMKYAELLRSKMKKHGARVWLAPGSVTVTINDRVADKYLGRRVLSRLLGYHDTLLLRAEEILQEDVQADMSEVRRIFEQRFFEQRFFGS